MIHMQIRHAKYQDIINQTTGVIPAHIVTDITYGDEFDIAWLLEKFTGTIITFEKPNRYFYSERNGVREYIKPTREYFWIKPSLPKNTVNSLSNPVESIYVWQRAPFNEPKVTGMSNGNYSAVRYDQIEGVQYSPLQKPASLIEWLLRLHTAPGDAVWDICAGTGTTLLVGDRIGRRVFGIEKDAAMIEIYERRKAVRE